MEADGRGTSCFSSKVGGASGRVSFWSLTFCQIYGWDGDRKHLTRLSVPLPTCDLELTSNLHSSSSPTFFLFFKLTSSFSFRRSHTQTEPRRRARKKHDLSRNFPSGVCSHRRGGGSGHRRLEQPTVPNKLSFLSQTKNEAVVKLANFKLNPVLDKTS